MVESSGAFPKGSLFLNNSADMKDPLAPQSVFSYGTPSCLFSYQDFITGIRLFFADFRGRQPYARLSIDDVKIFIFFDR